MSTRPQRAAESGPRERDGFLPRRRTVLKGLAALPLAWWNGACARERARAAGERPNLVLLIADSMRAASLPMYGYPRPTTPFLNVLARSSLVFECCSSAATWTRPAITSILSGLHPSEHRQSDFRRAYPPSLPSVASELRKEGYLTAYFTANHAVGEGYGMEAHFDHVSYDAALEDYQGPRVTRECESWLRRRAEPGPLFVQVHYFPPHGPYEPPEEHLLALASPEETGAPAEVAISLGNPSPGRIPWYQAISRFATDPAGYRDRYEANVRFADALLADFFQTCGRLLRARRTVFFVTGDHGEDLLEHEHFFDHARLLSNRILHVPLLVHDTANGRRRRVSAPVSHVDLGTTFLSLAGAGRRLGPHGIDLLEPGALDRRRSVVSQVGRSDDRSDGGWALTRERWRLVYNDAPLEGLADLIDVEPPRLQIRSSSERFPTPGRPAALRAPLELSGVGTLVRLDVLTDFPVADRRVPFTGRILPSEADERRSPQSLWIGCRPETDRQSDSPPVAVRIGPGGELGAELEIPAASSSLPGPTWMEIFVRWRDDSGREQERTICAFAAAGAGIRLGSGVHLRAVFSDVPVVCPGDAVRISHLWLLEEAPPPGLGVVTELIDGSGRAVRRYVRPLLGRPEDPEVATKPLVEPWRLKGRPFGPLLLSEPLWLEVPRSARDGDHHLGVSLVDLGKEGATSASRPYLWEGPRIVGDPVAAFELARTRTRDCTRYGQLERAELLEDSDGRRALRELVRQAPEAFGEDPLVTHGGARSRRSPDAEEIRFGPLVRLVGYELERSPDDSGDLLIRFVWRALSCGRRPLSGELYVRAGLDATEPVTGSTWWFLGGTVHPSSHWRCGDVIRESVLLPRLPLEGDPVRLTLSLTERWEQVYSDGRLRLVVPAFRGSREAASSVDLGTVRRRDLPRARRSPRETKRRSPRSYRLFDLESDPRETLDLSARRPEMLASLRAELARRMAEMGEAGPGGPESALTPEARRRLRSLGYVVDD